MPLQRTLLTSVSARLRCLLLGGLVGASTVTALAQEDPFRLQVDVQQVGNSFNTNASFVLPLSGCQAWNYLIDYDAAVNIPGVTSSTTTPLGPNRARVERALRETILFFSIRMRTVLEFTELPNKGTDFVQVEGETRSHRGSWRLEPAHNGTAFHYHAVSEPDSSLPMVVIRYFLDKRLKSSFATMAEQGVRRRTSTCPS